MWKQRIKHTAAAAADALGLWALLDRAHRGTWTIVCYHRVLPAGSRGRYFCPDLVVTPEALRAHCAVYREHFEVLTVCDAHARMQGGAPGKKPLLSLSFDDGYRDNLLLAAPVLAEFGIRASFYVVAGLADTDTLPWYDTVALHAPSHGKAQAQVESMKHLPNADRLAQLAGLADLAPHDPDLDRIMSAGQLRELIAAGHEVGSHSMTHPILTCVERSDLSDELLQSKNRLEAMIATPVTTFCYPNGDFNEDVLAGVRGAGYTAALSTRQGINAKDTPPHTLNRVFINQDWLRASNETPSPALLRAELGLMHRFRA